MNWAARPQTDHARDEGAAVPPRPDPVEPGALLAGRYRLTRVAGVGGMATIHRAWDERLERVVAVKVLHAHLAGDPALARRFRTEARHVAALSHPNIVQVYDQAIEPFVFMVMEYVDGPSLRTVLGRHGPLSPGQVVAVLTPVAQALAHAHRAGIVHRDVKPENVLIGHDGTPKVADFGIARLVAGSSHTGGALVGSLHYLSPEQVAGATATPASDQYALGITCYELLTGRCPLPGDTPVAAALRHLREDVPAPSARVPGAAALDPVVARATARDPAARFPDLDTFITALTRAVPGGPRAVPVPPPDGAPREATLVIPAAVTTAARPPRRRRVLAAGALLTVVAVIVATAAWWLLVWAPWRTVPDVTGAGQQAALDTLAAAGYDGRVAARRYDEGAVAGAVLRQEPRAGAALRRHGDVDLVVSRGPAPVTLPDVRGRSGARARKLLERRGFEVHTTGAWSDDVPAGGVISQLPPAGRTVPRGSRVELQVSKGRRTTTVPDLHDLDVPAARREAGSAGLEVDVERRPVPRFGPITFAETDIVVEQQPAAGATVRRGRTVTVVVFED